MKTTYSQAFKANTVTAAFNETIERDANSGRVAAVLLAAVVADYGLSLPSSPAAFVAKINKQFMTCEKGSAANVALVQVLHMAASAIIAAGRVKNVGAVLPLPAWADPVAIAAKNATAAAKRAETKAAKEAAKAGETPEVNTAKGTAPDTPKADVKTALNIVMAALKAGSLSPAQLSALRAACDTAQTTGKPAKSADTVKA